MAKRCRFLLFLPLVLFSFFTSASPLSITKSDFAALREIKNSLTDVPSSSAAATRFFSSWDFSSGADPCTSFTGVTCFSSRVTILSLGTGLSDSRGLAGTLSPAIAKLTELSQLILFSGIVTGPIPSRLGNLRNLKVISLTNNRLTGEIPPGIFNLPNLHTLDLSHNQLSGRIPPATPGLNQLKVLILSNNQLLGKLPSTFWDQLLHMDLSNNYITGTLPEKMPSELRYLSVSNNRLWGPIDGLESLSELAYLDLSMNRFSGPIPNTLFRPGITSMLLQRNNLSGLVPQSPPWSYVAGSTFDLSHNFLTGELTPALIGVETLFLNNNRLNGLVPEGYAQSVKSGTMKTLYLQHNYITGFPIEEGYVLPETTAVCLSYNCMEEPPLGMAACPASAGDQISRPAYQCAASRYHNSSSMV
ncbi:Leucine-rich repeat family protein [Dorcoceras hygrometricum]|uniref:Leucine-rich repeat family protein n=1 Tax=Dorcoceras hygrometricum TaxID=472368 RepID=A0A2Z7A703_9LAMI|nr:Leucine-rich repeat family protein [Dorcoceras hygrometricum]